MTAEQLERALRIQRYLEQPKQIGVVLCELGYVSKQQISEVLRKHGGNMRLGEVLLEQGFISLNDLERALELQRERGLKVGEALIELGVLSERGLLKCLAQQAGVPYIEPMFDIIEGYVLRGVSPDYLAHHGFVPFSRSDDGRVTVVVSDLQDRACIEAIRELYRDNFDLALGPDEEIRKSIEDLRANPRGPGSAQPRGVEEGEDESVVRLIERFVTLAIEERASDIHIEPMANVVRLRYRIDGVLVHKTDLPKALLPRVVSRIKIMAECNIAEHQRHQGGRIFFSFKGREYDIRLSVYVTVHGESIVLRILSKQTGLIELDELGMNAAMVARYRDEALDAPTGVVLITGPTGSGKTTTLYSSLKYCNSVETKTITAEDPVEYTIDGLVQCSIYDKVGRSFESTLREIVRQDPDIIVLGEIRDRESASIAIQAALTGHKVYSTFHTEDAIGGLIRLMDMGIETFLISSTVLAVVAQRLPRRICRHCAAPYVPSPIELDRVGLRPQEVRGFELKKGRGCNRCNYTGYFGRTGVYELLILNEDVKETILEKKSSQHIRRVCTESAGLLSMREDGVAKAIRGHTTLDEIVRHTPRTFIMRPLAQILAMTK